MKQVWHDEELREHWTLEEEEHALLSNKAAEHRLGLALQLKYYRLFASFPSGYRTLAPSVVAYLAEQVGDRGGGIERYDFKGRTGRRHRQEVLGFFGVCAFDEAVAASLRAYLLAEVLPGVPEQAELDGRITDWLLRNGVERPATYRLNRLVRSAEREHERRVLGLVAGRLDDDARVRLDALLHERDGGGTAPLNHLRSDVGAVGLDSVLREISKLERLRALGLASDILTTFPSRLIERLRRRAATEAAWELRRHPEHMRYPLLVFYCAPREAEIVDGLVELLLRVVHKIAVRAERRVIKEMLGDLQTVGGKARLLFRIAEAAHGNPDGTIREVIFPVVSEKTITDLVREARSNGPTYRRRVQTIVRTSYSSHYRRMLPKLLDALTFRSNNVAHRPVLDALALLKDNCGNQRKFYRLDEAPIEGVVDDAWQEMVVEIGPDGRERANRIGYEICVLQSLRDGLRCKEIWVEGADRFGNPDEDVPADFAERRTTYYERLGQPLDAEAFVAKLRQEMGVVLGELNRTLPSSEKVRLQPQRKHPIVVSPLEPLPPAPNLERLKDELSRRWPDTGLLDLLKEADLRTDFTTAFTTAATREAVEPKEVRRRLLLCLYGLGTNAGLKRMSSGRHGASYKELRHTRRRYLDKHSLRQATREVVNATLRIRQPVIWGEGTTACAADGKKFGAYDQNLMTEWHARYRGRGVMVYWHVERKSVCVYSQLKRCSSSEVASMIEGVLRHDTEMTVDKSYVDSAGQSQVAFAFCRLLGFELLPRLKGINRQRLYLPTPGLRDELANLGPILSKVIDWNLIHRQYDEMIKYATALRERTAEPEAILRRFTRDNAQHPTYRALAELGKAVKTIFLCRYLGSEDLRRQIHEGLNVVETWNGANGFIFFGRGGEVATNRIEEQELSVLALHLVQSCLVHVNTLMLQRVLADECWWSRLTGEDLRALTPLIYSHVNPYGVFELDLDQRLDIELPTAA